MTDQVVEPVEELVAARLLRTPEEVTRFGHALAVLAERMDPATLVPMHRGFDDATEDDVVMFGLIHVIEDFEREQVVASFLSALPEVAGQAGRWMTYRLIRILNSDSARELLVAILPTAGAEASASCRTLLDRISARTDAVAGRAAAVLGEASLWPG